MKTKTVYRCSIKQRNNYWVASPQYASMEDMMAVMTPWIAANKDCTVHFFQERVTIPETNGQA